MTQGACAACDSFECLHFSKNFTATNAEVVERVAFEWELHAMRFFKRTSSLQPAERAAVVERLNAVVSRGQAEFRLYPSTEEPIEPDRVERRFWSPDELIDARGNA
jgi:hypothetical protein